VYSHDKNIDPRELFVRILFALSLSFFIVAIIDLAFPNAILPQNAVILSLFCFGTLQFIWHSMFRSYTRMSSFAHKVLIVGSGILAQQMGSLIATPTRQHMLVGYYRCSDKPVLVPEDALLLDGPLVDTVRSLKVTKLVVALSERRGTLPLQDLLACKLRGVEVLDSATFYEQFSGKLLIENITPSWFIFSHGFRVTMLRRMVKRTIDISCALFGLLLTLPVLPLVVLAIKLDSKGPILFKQLRVGEGERNFNLYKLRSMRQDAEQQTGAVWAKDNDPRVTMVGRLLRKTRIDEVPQLFNVLRGDMSLIGPRPERPEFVAMLKEVIPYYSERHFVKPGVTGWAQVCYPYGASVEDAIEKLRYDLYYIKNFSIVFDWLIVLKTIHVVLFGKGGR
jgi:sugar transferase (PEP-CTERM system associated)